MGWFDGTIPRPPLVLFAEGLLEVIEGAAAGALAGRPAALLGGLVEVSRPGAAVEQAVEDVVVVGGHGRSLGRNSSFAALKAMKLLPSTKGGLVMSGFLTQKPPLP